MVEEAEREARRGLACVVESGDPRLVALLGRYEPGELWRALTAGKVEGAWARRAAVVDLGVVTAFERRCGLRFVVPGEQEWPGGLRDLDTCEPVQELRGEPVGLWLKGSGSLATLMIDAVAVVGSRASSAYGERVASDLSAGLVSAGTTIVSGGAYGIDAAAHRGALAEGGPTVAVLAGGLDQPYPRAHDRLLAEVAEAGVVVSEQPPGENPTRRRFLARNRIIAALTNGTVIVEAAARSGARNTVTWAGACARPVMAVPGPVGNATSYTPHRLIREGEAVLVTTAAEVREMVRPLGEEPPVATRRARLLDGLGADEWRVYEALPARGGRDAGEIAVRAGLSVPAALALLDGLTDRGLSECAADGRWRLGELRDRPLL